MDHFLSDQRSTSGKISRLAPDSITVEEIIRPNYRYLTHDLLNIQAIVDYLYQDHLIGLPMKQEIERQNAVSRSSANKVFIDHLITGGTEQQLAKFITLLRKSSDDCHRHKDAVEVLESGIPLQVIEDKTLKRIVHHDQADQFKQYCDCHLVSHITEGNAIKILECLYDSMFEILLKLFEPHLESLKDKIISDPITIDESSLKNASSVRKVFSIIKCSSGSPKWNNISLLRKLIHVLPKETLNEANGIMDHYEVHLLDYNAVARKKQNLKASQEYPKIGEIQVDIVIYNNIHELQYKNCQELWRELLVEGSRIPREEINWGPIRKCNSTMVTFYIPKKYMTNIVRALSKESVIWRMLELGVIKVCINDHFTFQLSFSAGCLDLRGGLTSGVDYLGSTKVVSSLFCALVDSKGLKMLPMPLGDFLFGKSLKDDMMDLGITPQAYQEVKKQTEQSIKIEDLEGELKAKNLELEEAESKCKDYESKTVEIEALKVKLKQKDEELRNREANLKEGLSKINEIDTKEQSIKIEDLEGELKAKNLELEEAESKCKDYESKTVEIEALKVKLKQKDEELRNREANLKEGLSNMANIDEIDTKCDFMMSRDSETQTEANHQMSGIEDSLLRTLRMDGMSGSYITITTTSGDLKQVSDGDIQAFIKELLPMIPEGEIILVIENSTERIRAKVTCKLDSESCPENLQLGGIPVNINITGYSDSTDDDSIVQSPSTNSQKLPHTKASGIESSFNSTPLKSTQSSQRTSSAPDTQSLQDVDTRDPIHKPQRPRELSHTSPQVRTTQKTTPSRSESLATTNLSQSKVGLHIVKLTWNSSKFKKEWIGDIIHKVLPSCKFQIRNWRPLEKLVYVKFLPFEDARKVVREQRPIESYGHTVYPSLVPPTAAYEEYQFGMLIPNLPQAHTMKLERFIGFVEHATGLSHVNGDFDINLYSDNAVMFFDSSVQDNFSKWQKKMSTQPLLPQVYRNPILLGKVKSLQVTWLTSEAAKDKSLQISLLKNNIKCSVTLEGDNIIVNVENPKDILKVRSVCCEYSTEEAPMFAEINYPDLYICKDERYRVKLPLTERVASFLKGRLNPLNIKLFKLHAVAIVDSTCIVIRPIGCYQPDEKWRMDCKTAAEDFQYGFSQLEVPFPQAAKTEAELIARKLEAEDASSLKVYFEGNLIVLVGKAAIVKNGLTRLVEGVKPHGIISQTISLPPAHTAYFEASNLKRDLEGKFGVTFLLNITSGEVTCQGTEKSCIQATDALRNSKVKGQLVKLSPEVIAFLTTVAGRRRLRQTLALSNNQVVPVFTNDEYKVPPDESSFSHLFLASESKEEITEMGAQLQKTFIAVSIDIQEDFCFVAGPSWDTFQRDLVDEPIHLKQTQSEIVIAGERHDVLAAKEKVIKFLEKAYADEASVHTSLKKWEMLKETEKWQQIRAEASKQDLKITVKEKVNLDKVIYLSGHKNVLKPLRERIVEALEQLPKVNFSLSRPGIIKLLLDPKGRAAGTIRAFEEKNKVRVIINETEPSQKIGLVPELVEIKHKILFSGYIPGQNKKIFLVTGDLTEMRTETIVNAASEELKHNGGVAKAISVKGGPIIQQESDTFIRKHGKLKVGEAVLMEAVGNLKCKALVHVVGPRWQSENPEQVKRGCNWLQEAVRNALMKSREYQSIALPAISTGRFRCPPEICADVMVTTILEFLQNHSVSIESVFIVLLAKGNITHFFKEALIGRIGAGVPIPELPKEGLGNIGVFLDKFSIIKEDISKVNADVLVSSANSNLTLKSGYISKALSDADPTLQGKCNDVKASRVLHEGDVVMIESPNLPAKFVAHAILPPNTALDTVPDVVWKIMEQADLKNAESIAFPGIGMGNLKLSPKEVALNIVRSAITYCHSHKDSTSIQSIFLVAFDEKVKEAFEYALRVSLVNETLASKKVGNLTFSTVKGRLDCEHDTDVVVHTISDSEAQTISNAVAVGDFLASPAPADCSFKHVFHFRPPGDLAQMGQCIKSLLIAADSKGCVNISIPAIPKFNSRDAATTVFKVIRNEKFTNLRNVRIIHSSVGVLDVHSSVVKEQPMARPLESLVIGGPLEIEPDDSADGDPFETEDDKVTTLDLPKPKFEPLPNDLPPLGAKVKITIYASSDHSLTHYQGKLQSDLEVFFGDINFPNDQNETFPTEALPSLPQTYITELYQLAERAHVKLEINQTKPSISVKGLKEDVKEVIACLRNSIARITERQKEKQQMDQLYSTIKWYYKKEEEGEWLSYPPEVNLQIEMSYKEGNRCQIDCNFKDRHMTFDLKRMIELPNVRIKRTSVSEDYPLSWDPMDYEALKNDHFVSFQLDPNDKEYQVVETEFCRSMHPKDTNVSGMNRPWSKIEKIERIQNPHLWAAFKTNLEALQRSVSGVPVERTLYHGCKGEVTKSINRNGFHYRMAGENVGVIYGKGIYFASEASYSANDRYSPRVPSHGDFKHIYQAKVITGRFVKGNKDLSKPPPVDEKRQEAWYDSVVDNEDNPKIFAIFKDHQVYPEYLITFS